MCSLIRGLESLQYRILLFLLLLLFHQHVNELLCQSVSLSGTFRWLTLIVWLQGTDCVEKLAQNLHHTALKIWLLPFSQSSKNQTLLV